MPRSLPCRADFALAFAEALIVGERQRLLQRGLIVAGVVGHDHRSLMRERPHEVLAPQLGRVLADFPRADFDQPLDDEGRFRPPGAAIGVNRPSVGIDRIDLAIDVRNGVLPRQQGRIQIGRHRRRERRHVGAEIGDGFGAQAQNPAAGIEGHFRVGHVIAAMSIGEEGFAAVGDPLHRTVDAPRRPQRDHFLRVDENFRAEAAADIGRDDAQLVLGRHADEGGDDEPSDVRILRRVPQRQMAGPGIVLGNGRAWLHSVRHQAIVDDIELGDVVRRLERGVDRFGIAEMPLVDGIVGCDLVDLRGAGLLRRRRIGDRRQHGVVDFHLFRGIARLRQRFGDHHRHRIADMARFADGERRVWRHLHRRAVFGMDHPAADEIADLVGGKFGTGEYRKHTRHAGGSLGVDRFDRGVGVRGADEKGVALTGAVDVVGVVALAGDEAVVFLAAHCGADPGRTHGSLLRRL